MPPPPTMAIWNDNSKCLWIGRSGLQYRKTLPCSVSRDEAADIVTLFFRRHGAVPSEESDDPAMTFTRGCKWTSRLSWLCSCSERWPYQTITVEFTPRQQALLVEVSYDVRLSLLLVCAPNMLVREARELQGLLEPQRPPD